MTTEELDAIEARAKAATEGPWTRAWERPAFADAPGSAWGTIHFQRREDYEFFENSRSDVPALVAEVRRMRGDGSPTATPIARDDLDQLLARLESFREKEPEYAHPGAEQALIEFIEAHLDPADRGELSERWKDLAQRWWYE